ncbi:MAG: response regulator [Bacteroidia bacterium]
MIKILIVDDEHDVELLFTQRYRKELRSHEFEFHFAFSGEEGLEYMRTLEPFDVVLVLSDINMPGMSGLELLKQIKLVHPDLKVMMITAYGDQKNYDEAIKLGANDFITKPVDFELLKERIIKLKAENK